MDIHFSGKVIERSAPLPEDSDTQVSRRYAYEVHIGTVGDFKF